VIDSRINQTSDITRRRRECPRCEGRFTTYERVEEVMPQIIKKDGRREAYIRDKLVSGVKKACQKRPVTTEKIDELITKIEKRIQAYGLKELPAKAIGQMVMIELTKLDKVAYVRFASVYREFKDVNEFVAELQEPSSPTDDNSLSFPFATPDEETQEGRS
jgi:transcriptional repressor NrdR